MKKSGFLLLVVVLFLVTTSLSAGSIGLSNSIGEFPTYEMDVIETKIDVREEVTDIGIIGEINAVFAVYSIRQFVGSFEALNAHRLINDTLFVTKAGGVAVRLKYPYALIL